ncbi:unnamed protein product, partial [Mesorhabditis belari]|uniref:Methenyltetrahydrofolate cyclohydrolase n=1 Tax=Mesorhabditis belari TaxID=2138241 RepID=A0AAF3EM32_9BILA
MVAVEISGIECSKKVLQEVIEKMEKTRAEHQLFQPCVAFVQVGNLVDASVYIRNAQKKAKEVGVEVKVVNLPETTIQKELETTIDELNNDDKIDGIILLLPLDCTNHIDADEVTDRIRLSKDVDGMTSGNIGRLASGQLDKITLSCSAFGCLRLVEYATAFVQVGNLVDASVYIRNAQKKAKEVGVEVKVVNLPETTIQKELETTIDELNNDDKIDGIILLLPLDCTNHIDADEVTDRIRLSKDVDGMTSGNIGRLASGQLDKITLSCSAFGCLRLVEYATGDSNYISGKNVVILGRSKIGGCPLSSLFLWFHGTVTVCHSETPYIKDHCQKADILVAAIGQKHFVKGDWIKPGALVIDAGFNVEEAKEPNGKSQFFGDVDTEAAKEIAGYITPVPGGVGPMTVAMLIWNTVELAIKRKLSQNK